MLNDAKNRLSRIREAGDDYFLLLHAANSSAIARIAAFCAAVSRSKISFVISILTYPFDNVNITGEFKLSILFLKKLIKFQY